FGRLCDEKVRIPAFAGASVDSYDFGHAPVSPFAEIIVSAELQFPEGSSSVSRFILITPTMSRARK
ncbi:MAG: hypothetical protein J5897_05525, partial [Candidatus Methanomethylophilus sp.]|nr:hypothetical protein [Methanomethylophilus sp.]